MDKDKTRVSIPAGLTSVAPAESCIVQIYGGDLGKKWPIAKELTIGRGERNSIVIDMDNVSRQHCRMFQDKGRCFITDLGSTNGTYVNDAEVQGRQLVQNGDLIKVGSVIFKFIMGGNIEGLYHEEIYRMTIIDGLTQIHNKRYFLDFLEREMARCSRYGRPLSLAMFDIDHFKGLNDTYGHLAGDYVLKKMAETISQHVRREELFARYGGEEFTIVLPELDLDKATVFGEKLRALVDGTEFVFDNDVIHTSISMGIALMEGMTETVEFIKKADDLLYEAKHQGRNRVLCG